MTQDYEVYKEGGLLNNRYKKLEDISEGSYGYVSLANDTLKKRLVAVKYIFKNDEEEEKNEDEEDGRHNSSVEKRQQLIKHQKSLISEKVRSKLSNNICFEALFEVDIHTKVGKHKNITEIYDYFDSFIIMEYCSGGDLYEAIRADLVPRKTKKITHIASQIMDAVEFVHKKGIYHRDIKPENILIDGSDWTIKLTDWGLATTEKTSMDRSVGSERYMAPELFEENLDREERSLPYDCSKVDIWAIGIVLLNVVFQKNPFSVANQTDKSFCYFAANREALFDVFSTMSYDFFQVLRHSLTIDPTNRDLASMKNELLKLGEYTLDDEFFNSQVDDDNFGTPKIEDVDSTPKFTSSTPTAVESPAMVATQMTVDKITPAPSHKDEKEKDPIPRFRFKKRSHPAPEQKRGSKPIHMDNRKVIKNSRKPLAIPTPNTHINNFFHEYKSKGDDNFNTRDFFTPPSVNNRYMEGIFNNKPNKYKNHRGNHNNAKRPNSIGSVNGNNKYTPKSNPNNLSSSYGRRGSAYSQHSPSTGKYIPPHSRPSSLYGGSPHIPNISSVLDNGFDHTSAPTTNTYHEQHPVPMDSNENDLDDVLFTLEENEIDSFTNELDNLTVQDGEVSQPLNSVSAPSIGVTSEVPDLLKSPTMHHSELVGSLKNPFAEILDQKARRPSTEYKYKPGVYVPPHHRKELAQGLSQSPLISNGGEATLSVNHNSFSYGSYNGRRSSTHHARSRKLTPTGQPFISHNHGKATTELQQNDIFADSNALLFEEDEDDNHLADQRSLFGPHDLYKPSTVTSPKRIRTGRKSSSIQDELIGSLEQYKNNWLILQQQQE
ncbi:LAFE_0D07382g1_1 [Lachancea fermentati]|uniref:LAFE_0D07382g1_1 n=1 Tax=Lachancea fermentati TaxID=4955 RepID=A0A1G4MBR6_LACFM|nr:LAFE_0D07382g1_1 [Lachancea fermentati]